MQNLMSRYINDESGATAIEYGLIAALISIALIVGGQRLGSEISLKFNEAASAMAKDGTFATG